MFVRDYMTRHPLMAEPTMPIVEAQRFMGQNNVRHLPVIGPGKRLMGLVTRQRLLVDPGRLGSLDVWDIARALNELTVADVMVKTIDVVSIGENATIEEAARLMVEKKIGCLPVLDQGIVIGILTETDLLAQLATMMGWPFRGARVTIRVPDKQGEFAKIINAIASHGWEITASVGVPAPKHPGYWDAVFKLRQVPKDELIAVLEQIAGHEVLDVREL
jgi:acetoin utilization protein AcuB